MGGLPDMEEGVLRTPLPAAKTFADDPLRVLRAVRFAARSRERSRGTQPVHLQLFFRFKFYIRVYIRAFGILHSVYNGAGRSISLI